MPVVITQTEYVSINGIELATPAWEVNDLSPLWEAAPLRGEDRIIPFSDGQEALTRIRDEMRVQVPLTIFGDKDRNGTTYTSVRTGLMTNVDFLRTNIWTPNPTAPGTWTLVLHMPDGTTRSAGCFVVGPMQLTPIGPGAVRAVLDIVIPAGRLT